MNIGLSGAVRSFRNIRAQTGLIFFSGLLSLVLVTFFVGLVVGDSIRHDAARLTELDTVQESLARHGEAIGLSGSVDVESLSALADDLKARLMGPDGQPLATDEREAAALRQANVALDQLRALLESASGRTPGNAGLRQIGAWLDAIGSALGEAEAVISQRHDGNTGMVRGMYAALFLSSLVFLLIGLWLIQQIIVAPVEALDQVARRIALGDFETPATLGGSGEFQDLAHSFETMRLELREASARQAQWAAELEARVTQRTQQLAALSQVIATASRTLELDIVLHTALEQALQAARMHMACLWLLDDAGSELHLQAQVGVPGEMLDQLSVVPLNEGVTGRAGVMGQPIVLEDVTDAARGAGAEFLGYGVHAMLAVPIKLRERVLGVMDLFTHAPHAFTPDEIALLTSIGQQTAIAVDSVHLMVEVRRQAERVAGLQERERIGIELHDGLLQTLGYLHLKADQAEAAAEMGGLTDLSRELGQHREILEQASHGVRQFIAGLQELPPPPASLREALAQMISELAEAPEIGSTPAVTIEASGSDMVLSADQVVHLVLIAREALINAGRHGKAARATVRCNRIDGHGELLIEDNGSGFSPNDLPADGRPRFGLAVMRARAARVGAEFAVQSAPGRGALVRARWLLEAPPATGGED